MQLNLIPLGDKVNIELSGNIDERGAEELKRRFLDLDKDTVKEIVLDFSGVTFIGSSGIGKLLLFYKNLADHGGVIRIDNMPKDIYAMFEVLKLQKILSISVAE